MSTRDREYLTDILSAVDLIDSFVQGIDHAQFIADLKCQSAVIRQLEIIGEATKRLSEEIRTKYLIYLGERWPECVIS